MQHRKSKNVFVFHTIPFIHGKQELSKKIVTEFLQKCGSKDRFRLYINQIKFIQQRIRTQHSVKYSKVDVLIIYWDRLINNIIKDKIKFKDKKADIVAMELAKISRNIRDACLRAYIDRCKEVYNIAFMQWRLLFPTTCVYWDEKELKDIIMSRINMQKRNIVVN